MARENILEVSETTKRRYFCSLVEQLSVLRKAMEKSDFEHVREICHRIRGSARLFGLADLGEACGDVEDACLGERAPERIVEGFQVIEVIIHRNLPPAEAAC